MNIIIRRSFDPFEVSMTVNFEEEDLRRAFLGQSDPDEALFYELMSPAILKAAIWEALATASRVAKLAVTATALNLGASNEVPK